MLCAQQIENRTGERQRAGMKGGEMMGLVYRVPQLASSYPEFTYGGNTEHRDFYNDISANGLLICTGRDNNVDFSGYVGATGVLEFTCAKVGSIYKYLYKQVVSTEEARFYQARVFNNGYLSAISKIVDGFGESSWMQVGTTTGEVTFHIEYYDSYQEAYEALFPPIPITYIPINSVLSGPDSAYSGESVNVSVSFPDGYIYQETGVSIYNKYGTIPFVYDNGTLTFTMP